MVRFTEKKKPFYCLYLLNSKRAFFINARARRLRFFGWSNRKLANWKCPFFSSPWKSNIRFDLRRQQIIKRINFKLVKKSYGRHIIDFVVCARFVLCKFWRSKGKCARKWNTMTKVIRMCERISIVIISVKVFFFLVSLRFPPFVLSFANLKFTLNWVNWFRPKTVSTLIKS